jgi:aerobic-type carbon monoxide dehydrogenase small subunit (CoxS/CutS family)
MEASMDHPAALELNGETLRLAGEHRVSLADFLRDAGANSVHLGCEHGVCGSCNVLVDGRVERSCLTLAHACEGRSVRTLEGLQDDLAQHLRAAFTKHHALQCGFCTPGVFVAAYELLRSGGATGESAVREAMSGNICRCTGYQGIVDAILDVAGVAQGETA